MAKDKSILKYNKFAAHYIENGNCTRAYMFAFPKATYGTAKTKGCQLLAEDNIKEIIEAAREEFNEKFMHSKQKTVQELIEAAEEAKADGQFNSYAKIRDMVIKLLGFYEPDKLQIDSNINVKFGDEDDD